MKRNTLKKIGIYILCLAMLLSNGSMIVRAEEELPFVDIGMNPSTTAPAAETPAQPTDPPTEEPAEEPAPEPTPEPTEEPAEAPTEPPTEPETTLAAVELVQQIINLRYTESIGSLTVVTEGGISTADPASVQEGYLLAKRLKKLAQISEFTTIVFRGSGAVNVRAEASPQSARVGRMYYNAVANIEGTVYAEDGQWYHITSGNVDGYVKSEFFVAGADALDLIQSIKIDWATPINDSQRLYKKASTNSDTLVVLSSDDHYRVISVGDEFTYLLFGETARGTQVTGYVPNDSIEISTELITAISVEEEQLSQERAAEIIYLQESIQASREESSRIRASIEESQRLSREARDRTSTAPATTTTNAYNGMTFAEVAAYNIAKYSVYIPAGTSAFRRSIAEEAIQYVGWLDYVWGGASLVYGADCSGFLQAIFKNHGISIAHYSYTIAQTGTKVVSLDQARTADILCYYTWAGSGRGHVALYIGNGIMVHAPDRGRKVEIGNAEFLPIHTIQNVIGD